MCGHIDMSPCRRAVGGRGPHAAAGRPARGLCGGSAGGVEPQDGSARGGGLGAAERSCGSTSRAQTPEEASSVARGHSRGALTSAGRGGGPNEHAEPVGLMRASACTAPHALSTCNPRRPRRGAVSAAREH
jgi:hypothetical protein